MKALEYLLFTAIIFLPIYSWSSGGMQISHYIFAIYCSSYIIKHGLHLFLEERILLLLLAVALVRESIAVFAGADLISMQPVAHIFFTIMIFNILRQTTSSYQGHRIVARALQVSAIVAVIGVSIIGFGLTVDSEGGRSVGTFNNPNQLGYFSVCLFSVSILLRLIGALSIPMMSLLVASSLFLAVTSLSKAALISIGFSMMLAGISFLRKRNGILIGLILLFGFATVYWLYSAGYLDQFTFIRRLEDVGAQSDDSLEGRGYYVFFQQGALALLMGLGSSAVREIVGHEVHSTIFSFFASYGVLGGLIFLSFILLWLNRIYMKYKLIGLILVGLPVFLFGITHNGSRFTIFWVLLALSFPKNRQEDYIEAKSMKNSVNKYSRTPHQMDITALSR